MNVGMSISSGAKRLRNAPAAVSSAYASAGPGDRRRGGPETPPERSPGAAPADDPTSHDWAPRPVDKAAQRKRAQGTAPIVPAKRRSVTGGSRRGSVNGESDLSDSAPPAKSEGVSEGAGEKVRCLSSSQRGPSGALAPVKEENKPAMRITVKKHSSSDNGAPGDSRDPSRSAEDGDEDDEDFHTGEDSEGGVDDGDGGDATRNDKAHHSLAQLAKAGNNLEAKSNEYRRASRRPRLDDCTEEEFVEDYLLFHKMTGRGAQLSKLGKANGIRLDLFNLYKQTCFYGGFVRTGNGSGINWAGQVFPNMNNFTHGNKATSIGNQLISTYSKFLVEYEQANQQDLDSDNCKICHQEMAPDGLEQWIACVKCENWFHYCCINTIEEQKIRPKSIAAKIYSFKQHEKQKGPDYTCSACLLGRQAVRSMGSYQHHQPHYHQQQQQQQQQPLQRSASLNNPSAAPRNPASAPRPPSAAPRAPLAAPSVPRGPSQAPRQPPTAPRTSPSEAPRQPQHGGASRPLPRESGAAAAAGGGGGPPSAAPRNPSNPPASSSADPHAPPRGHSSSSSGPSAPQPSQQPPQHSKVSVKVKMKEAPLGGGGSMRPKGPALASGTGTGGPNGSSGAAVPDLAAMQKTRAKVKTAIKEDKIYAQLSEDGFELTFSHFTSHAPGSGSSRAIVRMEPRDKAGQTVQQEVLARARRYASQDHEEAMSRFEESYGAVREAMQAAAAKQVQESLKRIAERVSKESPGMAVRVRVIQGSSAVEAVVEAAPDAKGPPPAAAAAAAAAPAAAPGSSSQPSNP